MDKVQFHVVNGAKQVVAGINYDLNVEVTLPGEACKTDSYRLYDKFGQKSLTKSYTAMNSCVDKSKQ